MLTILQKYLYREWLTTFLAITIVLLMVLLGVSLGDLLGDVADGVLPVSLVGKQLLYRLPEGLGLILPLSLFMGVMFGMGRLYRDNEMAVMRATGFTWVNMLKPLIFLVLPLVALLLVNGLVLLSGAAKASDTAFEKAYKSAVLWGLRPATFHTLSKGDLVIYIESMGDSGNDLKNIFLLNRNKSPENAKIIREQTWFAKSGRFWIDEATGKRYIELSDGEILDRDTSTLELKKVGFERAQLIMPENRQQVKSRDLQRKTSSELLASASSKDQSELQWRWSPALVALLMALLAIPLSYVAPRDSRGGRILIGLLVYALYINLLTVSRDWMASSVTPSSIGIWWVHVIFFMLAISWIWLQKRRLRL